MGPTETPPVTEWPPDPIHDISAPDTRWTSANAGEQMPGLLTPLTARHVIDPAELGLRDAFHDLGVLRRRQVHVAERVDEQHVAMFFGRFTTNVDAVRRIFDLTPGASGAAYEEQMFGSLKQGVSHRQSPWRYPLILVKMPLALLVVLRRSRKLRMVYQDWWRGSVDEAASASLERCRAIFQDSRDHLRELLRYHWVATMAAQLAYGRVMALAARADCPGLETTICGGYGTEEVQVAVDLWQVSREGLSKQAFLDRHGHNVPLGAELSARSWREDPAAIDGLLASYRTLPDDESPASVAQRRAAQREQAERRVLAGLPMMLQPQARLVFRLARSYIRLRTTSKGSMQVSFDVARAAARRAGSLMHADRVLADPSDVFYLTADELLGTLPADVGKTIRFRRARHELYGTLEPPEIWTGNPEPKQVREEAEADGPITGIGVSPGVVEGQVRVVDGPTDDRLEPGEILVCETTDPSWISLMVVSAALVIDIGGPVSHGAIVAREMGVPCVIGARNATARLETGQWVRVDGTAGTVVVDLER